VSAVSVRLRARRRPWTTRIPRLPYGWPVVALFGLFPVWWVLGLAGFIWVLLAVPMAMSLLMRPRIRAPRGFGLWLLFLFWMLASGVMLDEGIRWIPFLFRAGQYFSATILLLYVYNAPRSILPDRRVILAMVSLWVVTVVGGYLGIVLAGHTFATPVERLLPHSIASNAYVQTMVHPGFGQVAAFLGYPWPRPNAPFEYTNDWGASFALLMPFVLLAFRRYRSAVARNFMRAMVVASIVPLVVSMNRGLWLSLSIGIVYAGIRLAAQGRTRPLASMLLGLAVIGLILGFSPLRGLIEQRFEHQHSNQGRLTLYQEATAGVLESPLLGYGSPQPNDNPNFPSVGTQGQLWLLLYSHGFPGAILFIAWYVSVAWRLRRGRDDLNLWMQVVVVISIVQLAFYGQVPAQIHITFVAMALGMRALLPEVEAEGPSRVGASAVEPAFERAGRSWR
jgi:polysaccharide biosynthesis protein PslJ